MRFPGERGVDGTTESVIMFKAGQAPVFRQSIKILAAQRDALTAGRTTRNARMPTRTSFPVAPTHACQGLGD